ncbi:MAG TPA: AEC family transporter [Firmicutes bacterium]|nr:AEC family transporter [Candidatus Fermentithermobacillaceae bacterium]
MAIDAVLPALLIAFVGYVAGKKLNLDKATVSRLCFYVLTPALTFRSLATSEVDLSDAWKMSAASFLMPFVFALSFSLAFRAARFERATSRGLLLASMFANSGNYGLPVSLFAFGQEGMDLATVYFVIQGVILATFGVYVAASTSMSTRDALFAVARMPAVYAALAGLAVKLFGLKLPEIVSRPVGLLADGGIGVFLFLLGLQLVGTKADPALWKPVSLAVALRLLAAPFLAAAVGRLIGLSGLPLKILVLQSAMPPAVNATILAHEFDAKPDIVSCATLVGTLVSTLTLSAWIMALRAL